MTAYIVEIFQTWGYLSLKSGAALALFFFLAALVVFPRTILIVAAGASFGMGAAPIILVAGTAGGTVAFLLSRYVASAWFRRKLAQRPNFEAIADAIDRDGWRIIALMRLGVPVPSALQNYLFGLTRINLATYIFATLVFSCPQVFLFSLLGATGRASLLEDKPLGLTLISMLATAGVIALLAWRVRKLFAASSNQDAVKSPPA